MLWLVAAVAIRTSEDTAAAAPLSVQASLMLKRSEMNARAETHGLTVPNLFQQRHRGGGPTGQRVEAEFFQPTINSPHRGRPSPRWAMMLRWTSLVPA